MAKKKKKNGKGKSKSKGINIMRLAAIGGGIFADRKFINEQLTKFIDDDKMRAVAKIAIGEFLPKQDFAKNLVKDQDLLDGFGASMTVVGIEELMTSMNIAGMGEDVSDDDSLAVVLDGVDDIDGSDMNADIDTVNEDVLGGDIDTVNEDVLGIDDDGDEDMY